MRLLAPMKWGGWELTHITHDGMHVNVEGTVDGVVDKCVFQAFTPTGIELIDLMKTYGLDYFCAKKPPQPEDKLERVSRPHDYSRDALF